MLKHPISRGLVFAGASLLAIAPFFWWGSPSGHDFEFHMYSWMEVLGQWRHGILYPRWAALAHWGYGEARFLFYPPASWTLGAALGATLPWKMVPGAYCWTALTLAAFAMYRLAREWLTAQDALFAAVFYALNPYHLMIIYWRSAYAELLAAALAPLALLCLLRIRGPGGRPTLWLSLLLARAWLTNAPAALMIHYSVAGLAIFLAAQEIVASRNREKDVKQKDGKQRYWGRHIWRPLFLTALAMILGASLASFYLLPTIREQGWVNINEVLAPGVRPIDNFIFTKTADPDHNRFNFLISIIALAELGLLALAICASRWRQRKYSGAATDLGDPVGNNTTALPANPFIRQPPWVLLSLWSTACAFFMLPASNFLWRHLPKFRFVQLPFRWLLCMNVALAILVTMATKRWTTRLLLFFALLTTLIVAGYRIQQPWWDTDDDIQEMRNAIVDGTGYEGTDEYVPAQDDAYELNKSLPRVSDDSGAQVRSEILAWEPTQKHFIVHAERAENITVRLFDYPAWAVVVNGKPATIQTTEVTGLIVIPLAEGSNDVRIFFRRTMDRIVGNIVSFVGLIIFVLAWMFWHGSKSETWMRRPSLQEPIL